MTDMATYTGAFSGAQVTWSTIKWSRVYRNVRRLQARIVKATQAKRWGKVKALQRLKLEVVKPRPEKGVWEARAD
jgi:RNA-directed DNA polymerase